MRQRHRLNVPASELAGRRQANESEAEPPDPKKVLCTPPDPKKVLCTHLPEGEFELSGTFEMELFAAIVQCVIDDLCQIF